MRSNFLLILGFCTATLQQRLLGDVCYEKDKAPVDLDADYHNNCVDLEGNIYRQGSELDSCCDCFRLERTSRNYNCEIVTRKI